MASFPSWLSVQYTPPPLPQPYIPTAAEHARIQAATAKIAAPSLPSKVHLYSVQTPKVHNPVAERGPDAALERACAAGEDLGTLELADLCAGMGAR